MFKVKYHSDRSIARFKAQLVVQGFSQIPGINFAETFTSIMRKKLLQIYLAICLFLNLIIYQIDIIGAYLDNNLSDNKLSIFMKLPPRMHQLRSGKSCFAGYCTAYTASSNQKSFGIRMLLHFLQA